MDAISGTHQDFISNKFVPTFAATLLLNEKTEKLLIRGFELNLIVRVVFTQLNLYYVELATVILCSFMLFKIY